MTLLCCRHGISRKTGYKWLQRYRAQGAAGLADRSSARPTQTEAYAASILALRRARPGWGPRKLLARLAMDHPDVTWPAASTVGDVLARQGLVTPRSRQQRQRLPDAELVAPLQANEIWSADFKGWFRIAYRTA